MGWKVTVSPLAVEPTFMTSQCQLSTMEPCALARIATVVLACRQPLGKRIAGRCGAVGRASLTVTLKLPELLFPAASLTVQFTVVVPIGNLSPDVWEQM